MIFFLLVTIDRKEIEMSIEKPKGADNGDYAYPCFKLAKVLRKAPPFIAEDIKSKIIVDEKQVTKIEVAGGYLNFFVKKVKAFHKLDL